MKQTYLHQMLVAGVVSAFVSGTISATGVFTGYSTRMQGMGMEQQSGMQQRPGMFMRPMMGGKNGSAASADGNRRMPPRPPMNSSAKGANKSATGDRTTFLNMQKSKLQKDVEKIDAALTKLETKLASEDDEDMQEALEGQIERLQDRKTKTNEAISKIESMLSGSTSSAL